MANWVDSHSHLADLRWGDEIKNVIEESRLLGIHFHLQGGVSPEDWTRQRILKSRYPEIGLCLGLHPYFVSEKSDVEVETALNQLARELLDPEVLAIGEIGLDLRPHIVKGKFDQQMDAFVTQLELAHFAQKPQVYHFVQAFDEAKNFFDHFGLPTQRGMVHAFNGSLQQAEYYLQKKLFLSIGGACCRSDNLRLHQAIQIIPLTEILIESDSPDQPPPHLMGQLNRPRIVLEVAEIIAKIKKVTREEVLDISAQNLEIFLHGNIRNSQPKL